MYYSIRYEFIAGRPSNRLTLQALIMDACLVS